MLEKNHILCWSGGIDSTCILFDLLNSGKKIRIISFNNEFLSSGEEDKKARLEILKILKKYHSGNFTYEEHELSFLNNYQGSHWFSALGLLIQEPSIIHLGYIRTDDFWHMKDELETVFHNLQKLNCVKSELVYDYEWKTKEDVIKMAKKIDIYKICVITKYIEEKNNANL